uniref:Hematopoietic cell-specific Lyn substrate 1 n=1 Tax=Periophthalmus magnuspinnatus TaxID=409849 RepID=A0A3B4ASU4_9GOBI
MWRAAVGQNVNLNVDDGGDDWETDPDFENDVSEKEQRWGAKTVAGSGHQEHINLTWIWGQVWSAAGPHG